MSSTLLLDRLKSLQAEKTRLMRQLNNIEERGNISYSYLDNERVKRERDIKSVKSVTYTLELARSGLLIVERILKEMRTILVNKAEFNNPIYTIQLDLLKGELNCINKLFVYDSIEIFNPDGFEWDIGCSKYKWYTDLNAHISNIDYTNNGPKKIDIITANIARSYIDIDSILLNVNINNSAILDNTEINRSEIKTKELYDRLRLITTEINDIIACILEKV